MNIKNVAIGFITYENNTAKYLPYFLKSLFSQTYNNFDVFVIDNSKNKINKNSKYINKNYPQIKLEWIGENIGFARAYNKMINISIDMGFEYFLVINPDMILEKEMLMNMVNSIKINKKTGVVSPKILKWDFKENKKTNIVDSYGLSISKELCFYDRMQGMKDISTKREKISGFTGAGALFNIKTLEDIKFKQEYFDELMFMYKEDWDLSIRLYLAGWDIIFEPKAIAYHDRSAIGVGNSLIKRVLNRKIKDRQVNKWSFLNHWILFLKYRKLPISFLNKLLAFWYQFKVLIFIILFEQYLLKEFVYLFKIRKKIKEKKQNLVIRINKEIKI